MEIMQKISYNIVYGKKEVRTYEECRTEKQ